MLISVIIVSMIAEKIYNIPQIIARVNDPEKKFIYQKLNIVTIDPIQYETEILKSKLAGSSGEEKEGLINYLQKEMFL